jgi:hypothetical protein
MTKDEMLEALDAEAVRALKAMYGQQPETACFWMQKGIEVMRYAVAEAIIEERLMIHDPHA